VARIPWRIVGREGEDRLAQGGISVRCLLRGDDQPVEDTDDDAVEALLARAY
jgi:prolyl-tRNA synthetase